MEVEFLQENIRDGSLSKQTDMKVLIIVAVLLSVLAGGIGWFLGSHIDAVVPLSSIQTAVVDSNEHKEAAIANVITEDSGVVVLPSILTNMAAPETAWIRMECALVLKSEEKISSDVVAEISGDFLAFLRDSTLSHIKGSTGLMYLREDLLERANIRSGGKVAHILISGLVVEE